MADSKAGKGAPPAPGQKMAVGPAGNGFTIRTGTLEDLDALDALEQRCFQTDRLSRRSFKRWLASDHALFLVAQSTVQKIPDNGPQILGYSLVILHRGTRLARLYSIAVSPDARGMGLGLALMKASEAGAINANRIDMRLEVREDNTAAIRLYEQLGYRRFGEYDDYYEDHETALRFQKRIRYLDSPPKQQPVPWYRQTTDFTCGPASLMMAMQALDKTYRADQGEEMQLWREATTIFMTTGHGGCHPLGLALAAKRRGFQVDVWISHKTPLFVDSVRNEDKRNVIALVHEQFRQQARQAGIPVHYKEITQQQLDRAMDKGAIPVILISTWQMDHKRTPHWVVMAAADERFIYMHDPDPDEELQTEMDCQYLPIARSDFEKMARFGRDRLRTAVIIRKD